VIVRVSAKVREIVAEIALPSAERVKRRSGNRNTSTRPAAAA